MVSRRCLSTQPRHRLRRAPGTSARGHPERSSARRRSVAERRGEGDRRRQHAGWAVRTGGHGRRSPNRWAGTVTTASTTTSARYVPRQSRCRASVAVMGANTVLANPPTKESTVNAATLRDPNHRVKAANAGAYSTAPIARPAAIQPPRNNRCSAPSRRRPRRGRQHRPAFITHRGPCRSSHLPTPIPNSAEVTSPAETVAVTAGWELPVSLVMRGESTMKAW